MENEENDNSIDFKNINDCYSNIENNENTIKNSQELENQMPNFEIRSYQLQIYEKCIDNNSVVVLDTGTGKTIVALCLICHHIKKYSLKKKVDLKKKKYFNYLF